MDSSGLRRLDVGALMGYVGASGVTMMLKIDDERQRAARRPWTVLLAGEPLGRPSAFRSDCTTLEQSLTAALRELETAADVPSRRGLRAAARRDRRTYIGSWSGYAVRPR